MELTSILIVVLRAMKDEQVPEMHISARDGSTYAVFNPILQRAQIPNRLNEASSEDTRREEKDREVPHIKNQDQVVAVILSDARKDDISPKTRPFCFPLRETKTSNELDLLRFGIVVMLKKVAIKIDIERKVKAAKLDEWR